MIGLTSPLDIIESFRTAERVIGANREAEKLAVKAGSNRIPPTFEEVLMEKGMSLAGPETAIMKAMDAGFEREDDRRNGRTRSAFDFIAGAEVSSAVASLYAKNSRMKPELSSKDPFSPAAAVSRVGPDFSSIMKSAIRDQRQGSPDEAAALTDLLTAAFPEAYGYDPLATGADSSAAEALRELTRTVSPRLMKTLGYNQLRRDPGDVRAQ